MWIKKRLLAVNLIIIVFLLIPYISAIITFHAGGKGNNPFSLYGEGNCCYLAYKCTELYWPATFDIPRNYDAYQWKDCAGQEKDGYKLTQVDEPKPGDLFVTPATPHNKYGHVGMITGIRWSCNLETGDYSVWYEIIDSAMYATRDEYPETLGGCRYRFGSMHQAELQDAVYLRCVPIKSLALNK